MVAMCDIQAFSDAVAREFEPERIILFGSHARGDATADSDVDLFVILPGKGAAVDKSLDIRTRLRAGFPLDLLTRSAGEVERRIAMDDWFILDILEEGKTLYERSDA